MLEGCCCFVIGALRLVPDCHFRNRLHKRLFTSHFPPPWSNEKLPLRSVSPSRLFNVVSPPARRRSTNH